MTAPVDDEFSELVDADIPRVDLVDKGANGIPRFLIAKRGDGSAGLMDAAFVRGLIGKPEPVIKQDGETVTMSGSPAAIARFIHQAAQRVEKTGYDTDDRKRMAANGESMPDGSYPIADTEDLTSAIHAVGRGGADHNAIRRHVIARAKALGATADIPDNWNADGSLKGSVTKETDMADDALDASVVLAEPENDAPGMDTDPGSPAWEAIDAATARKWTGILARAKAAIDLLADREMLEAAAGDEDDAAQAMDLQDACCAIDYAISVLAPFAVAEQAEADCCDDMTMVGKALAGFDPLSLDTIESLGHVRKAGRVLSSANEAAIRDAAESLQKVLASLPQAPTAPDDGQQVAKEQETAVPTESTSAAPADEPAVTKADGEKTPMVVVYDQKGRLIGIVDPADVTPVANSEADPEPDAAEAEGVEAAAADATPEAADLHPAPAGEVGTPADAVPDDDAVAKQTTTNIASEAVLKSIADVVKQQLDAHSAAQQEALAKMVGDLAAATETIGVLKGQVQALEEQPAQPKVFTNGAVPPAHHLRGQDRSAQPVDVTKAQDLKKGLYGAADAGEQNRIAKEMQTAAIDRLQQIHQRRA